MYDEASRAMDVRDVIAGSCIPLLCGSGKEIRRAARLLHRLYGLSSYALPVGSCRFLLPHYLKRISEPCRSPQLLAKAAIRFFASLDPNALPVLLDCTEDRILLGDPTLRASLECHCFLSEPNAHTEIPPFCYLTPHDGGAHTERSQRPC